MGVLSARGFVAFTFLSFIAIASVSGQDFDSPDDPANRPYAGALIVLSTDSAPDVSPVVARVIASAARDYLEELGIVVVEGHEVNRYQNLSPDLELDVFIELVDEGAHVHYSLSLPGSNAALTELDYSQSVGLNLNRAVAESMGVLLEQADQFVSAAAAGRADNPARLELRPTEAATVDQSATEQSPGDEEQTQTPMSPATGTATNTRVEIAAGIAPLFPVGRSADYFAAAFGADLRAAVMLGPTRSFSVGVSSRLVFSMAEGAATIADLLLVPIGVEIRLLGHDLFSPTAYASGGVAIVRAVNPVLGEFIKVVPSAIAGIGMTMRFRSGFGVAAQIDFSAYFEGSTVIMGFSPTLTANMEL